MKKKNQKMWSGILAAVIAVAALTGCGGGSSSQAAEEPEAKSSASSAAAAVEASSGTQESDASQAEASSAGSAAGQDITIGRIELDLAMPYQQADAAAFEAYAESKGIEAIVLDGKSSPETIASSMEDLIAKNVDGIIVQANDGEAISPFVQEAQDAGIPVLTFVNASTVPGPNAYLAEYDLSYELGAQTAKRWMEFHPDEPVKVATLGIPAAPVVERDRCDAFVEGVLSVASDAEVVARLDSAGVRDQAVSVADDLLQSHPEVNIVFGVNGDAALGGMTAFEAAGRGKAVDGVPQTEIFASVDGSEQEMVRLADPTSALKLCMALPPKDFAEQLMDLMLQCINGEIDWKEQQDIDMFDVMFDYWNSSIDDLQAFLTDQYKSSIDLKKELGL